MVININDDRMIMEFLSGRYLGTPDGHAVYMNYPLTGALAALYRLCPNVDWYGYFLVTVMAVCIAFVCGRIQKMAEGKKRKLKYVVSALGICTFALGREFFSMTYTTVAAVCGAAALFSYATSDGSGKNIAVTAAFSALTWCIRDELFWMIVPMAGLCWLFYELPQKKKLYRKFMLPAAVFGCVTVCMLCNHFMYSAPEWQEYLHFNELRTEIYDYNDGYYMPSYEEYREYYDRLGLSKAERRMLIYYHFLPIEDEISAETLEQMIEIRADYGINEELPPLRTRLPLKTKEFLIHMADGSYGILFFVGAAGMLLLGIRLFIMKDRKAALISIVYLLTGLGLFWMMELRGRLPERVIYSLSLLLFTMFVCNVLWNRERLAESRAWKQYLTAGVLVLSAIGLSRTVQTIDANRAVIENGKELAVIQDYCRQREKISISLLRTSFLNTATSCGCRRKIMDSKISFLLGTGFPTVRRSGSVSRRRISSL